MAHQQTGNLWCFFLNVKPTAQPWKMLISADIPSDLHAISPAPQSGRERERERERCPREGSDNKEQKLEWKSANGAGWPCASCVCVLCSEVEGEMTEDLERKRPKNRAGTFAQDDEASSSSHDGAPPTQFRRTGMTADRAAAPLSWWRTRRTKRNVLQSLVVCCSLS